MRGRRRSVSTPVPSELGTLLGGHWFLIGQHQGGVQAFVEVTSQTIHFIRGEALTHERRCVDEASDEPGDEWDQQGGRSLAHRDLDDRVEQSDDPEDGQRADCEYEGRPNLRMR